MNGQGDLFGLAEGRRRRDETLDRFQVIRAALLDILDREMQALSAERVSGIVTGDDAYRRYDYWRQRYEDEGRPLPEFDRRFLGAIWARAHWEKVGWTQTQIPTRHARPISQWRLAGCAPTP